MQEGALLMICKVVCGKLYVYICIHIHIYLIIGIFARYICVWNKKTIKGIKTNSSEVSDAKDILINHDNENEVTFILMTVSSIFNSAVTEAEKICLLRLDLPHSLK